MRRQLFDEDDNDDDDAFSLLTCSLDDSEYNEKLYSLLHVICHLKYIFFTQRLRLCINHNVNFSTNLELYFIMFLFSLVFFHDYSLSQFN